MSSDKLDRHIQQQIHTHQSDVDAEAIWEAVQPKPKKKRFLWWYWPVGIGSVLAIVVAVLLFNKTTNNNPIDNTTAMNTPIHKAEAIIDTTCFIEHKEQSIITTKKQKPNTTTQKAKSSSAKKQTNTAKQKHHKQHAKGANITTKSSLNKTHSPIAQQQTTSPLKATNNTITNTQNQQLNPIANTNTINDLDTLATAQNVATLSFYPYRQNDQQILNPTKPLTTAKQTTSPWAIQVSTAVYHIQKEWRNDSDSMALVLNDLREATESLKEATSIEIGLSRFFKKHWQVQAGLNYTQINSQFKHNNTWADYDSMGTLERITTHTQQINNSIRQWNIPVSLAYIHQKGAWQMYAQAGLQFNIQQKAEGRFFTLDNMLCYKTMGIASSNTYKKKMGLSYQMAIGAAYELFDHTYLSVDINASFFPNAFTNSNAFIEERYRLFGLRLGLRREF